MEPKALMRRDLGKKDDRLQKPLILLPFAYFNVIDN